MSFIRKCPKCDKEIIYKNKKILKTAIKNNKLCASCSRKKEKVIEILTRICPECNNQFTYKSKGAYEKAIKFNKMCRSCTANSLEGKKIRSENAKKYSKLRNGKTNYKIIEEKYGHEEADKRYKKMVEKCKEKSSGKNNPMYKKSFYDIWLKQYGEEIANIKLELFKNKISQRNSGENNPMFGKPCPKGSKNGWSGYYKNYYFRSQYELFYLIYLIENNIKFISAENNQYKVEYEFEGFKRNYFPDFYLIDIDKVIEIKPQKFVNSIKNKAKFKAAKNKYGDKFKILTEKDICFLEIGKLYEIYKKGNLSFLPKYEEKFLNRLKKEGFINGEK